MITVLMPVYNEANFLENSINSILHQSYKNFEFLILDDGSTDNTEEKIKSFTDLRIKYIKLPHQGMGSTLNYGLSIAKYDIIARMDADDLAHPNRLEAQLNFITNNTQYDLVSSWYAVFSKNKIISVVKSPVNHSDIKRQLALHSPICHPGVLLKKRMIPKDGFKGNVFEDYEMWLRTINTNEFHILPEVLTFVRFRKDSYSREDISSKYKIMYQIQKPYYDNSFKNFFGIKTNNMEIEIRGWREYFYGSKTRALRLWMKLKMSLVYKPRIVVAIITLLLPSKFFILFKEFRIKYRLQYLFTYLSLNNRNYRKVFSQLKKQ